MNPINKIFLGVGAAIALFIAITFLWLSLANAHLRTELAEARANDTACHIANDDFTDKIAEQNKIVEKLKSDSVAREKRAQAAAAQSQEKARIYFVAAEKLRKEKAHGDVCKAADKILSSYIAGDK